MKGLFKNDMCWSFTHPQAIQVVGDSFLLCKTVKKIFFSWNQGPWWFINCKKAAAHFWDKAYQGTQNEYQWPLMMYWDHTKRNDFSVPETEHYLQQYYL